jgi:hypothetical protein
MAGPVSRDPALGTLASLWQFDQAWRVCVLVRRCVKSIPTIIAFSPRTWTHG